MEYTVEKIAATLGASEEQVLQMLRQAGVNCNESRALTESEMGLFRTLLLRYYEANTISAAQNTEKPVDAPVIEAVPVEAPLTGDSPVSEQDTPNQSEQSAAPEIERNPQNAVLAGEVKPAANQVPQSPVNPVSSQPPTSKSPARPVVYNTKVDPKYDKLVSERQIMIDTCSLMHNKCGIVIDNLIPALQKHGKKVIIPNRVLGELKKHQRSSDQKRVASANSGMRLCQKLLDANCLDLRGSKDDNFADNVFFVILSNYRFKYSMLLITQDRGLTSDILRLNTMQAEDSHPIEVRWITGRGELRISEP